MTQIEIELPIDSMFSVFDSKSISTGMTIDAPGGARIKLQAGPPQSRSLTYDFGFLSAAVTLGKDVAVGVFVAWLAPKILKSKRPSIRINRRTVEKITAESIESVIEEEIQME